MVTHALAECIHKHHIHWARTETNKLGQGNVESYFVSDGLKYRLEEKKEIYN